MSGKPFDLGQDFVDRVMSEDADSPAVQGAGARVPLTPEAWRRVYMDTLIKHAELTEEQAAEFYETGLGGYDYSDDPEMAAIGEMEYWTDDGDGPDC